MAPTCHIEERTYQIEEASAFGHSDRLVTIGPNSGCLKQKATDLSSGHLSSIKSSESMLDITASCFDYTLVVGAVKNSNLLENTSSSRFRHMEQLQFAHSSENTCTAIPMGESEAMRKWKEIKQNGFLSHPHGGVPIPEPQHGKKSKRKQKGFDYQWKMEATKQEQNNQKMEIIKRRLESRKMETVKRRQDLKKIERAKGEHDNMVKTAPSSGLLSRIRTGIIRRVKNYEEVHSILEAMVTRES